MRYLDFQAAYFMWATLVKRLAQTIVVNTMAQISGSLKHIASQNKNSIVVGCVALPRTI